MNLGSQGGRQEGGRWTAGMWAWMGLASLFLVLGAGGCSDGPPEHGVQFTLAPIASNPAPADLSNAVQVLRRRIQLDRVRAPHAELSATGTIILRFQSMSQEELGETRRALTNAGWLEFRRIESVAGTNGAGGGDSGREMLPMPVRRRIDGREVRQVESFAVRRAPERGLTGRFLKRAYVTRNPQTNEPEIALEFDPEGAERFFRVTTELAGLTEPLSSLAIVLDGRLQAAPVVRQAVADGRLTIPGEFDTREALNLAGYLNFPLPLLLRIVDERDY